MIRIIVGSTENLLRDTDARIFDETSFSVDALREELETPSLFGDPKNVILLYVIEQFHDELFSFLESYEGAGNVTLREQELSLKDEKFFKGIGATIIGTSEKKKAAEFNVWPLTDAVLARDKKNAWLLYREAIEQGSAPEELSGIVWWQVKSILLVAREGSPKGMKPFTLNKTKRALQKYTTEEIEQLAQKLITAIHEPRAGNGKAEEWMESFLLSM